MISLQIAILVFVSNVTFFCKRMSRDNFLCSLEVYRTIYLEKEINKSIFECLNGVFSDTSPER